MSRNLVRPFFPVAPVEYNQQYMSEVVRSFSVLLEQLQNPGEGRNTALTLTALQTDDYNLRENALFQQGGFVKISLPSIPHPRGVSGTAAVGTVTVTTT
jgi:hypothetical protein